MNVGIVTYYRRTTWDSVDHVVCTTAAALRERHELQYYPDEFPFAPRARRRELLTSWLARCDVVVGIIDEHVLEAREDLSRPPPYVCFMLGSLPRGGPQLAAAYRYLRTSDVLVVNCTADRALCERFVPNATIRVVPFGIDTTMFYPEDEAARARTLARLGVGPSEKVLLYSGRMTLEKNLHTLLKTFSVAQAAVPGMRLLIAGSEMNAPFLELGVFPLGITRSLKRTVARLGLEPGRVVFIGQRGPDELRALYSAADVLVNLTLHHDENFGLAQIEAMACGTPVVGTTWGGLKDTVIDGVTGAQVPAIVTAAGVKVDWWSAANRIVGLMSSEAPDEQARRRCRDIVHERYSLPRYSALLEQTVLEATSRAGAGAEPLQPSEFARELWASSRADAGGVPYCRRGPQEFQLYRDLIAPFADTSARALPPNGAPCTWCLAAPLTVQNDGITVVVHDPIFPLTVRAPGPLAGAIRAWAARFGDRPILRTNGFDDPDGRLQADALDWMYRAGLILHTEPGTIDPACAGPRSNQPLFTMRAIDHSTDVVWLE